MSIASVDRLVEGLAVLYMYVSYNNASGFRDISVLKIYMHCIYCVARMEMNT
jgi:hypothetical protein